MLMWLHSLDLEVNVRRVFSLIKGVLAQSYRDGFFAEAEEGARLVLEDSSLH